MVENIEIRTADTSCEPMDVDRSLNSTGKAASSPESSPIAFPAPVGGRSKRRQHQKHTIFEPNLTKVKRLEVDLSILEKKRSGISTQVLWFLAVIVIICGSYYQLRANCCSKASLSKVHRPLLNKLYGQDRAIEKIMDSFRDETKSKISFLYGSSGVGKTYASQIILESIHNHSNVFHSTLPGSIDSFWTSAVQAELIMCDFVFIVIDDIEIDDENVLKSVSDIMNKSIFLHKDIHLMLIFNSDIVSDDFLKSDILDFKSILEFRYRNVGANKFFIEFAKLTNTELKMCIEEAMLSYKHQFNHPENLVNNLLEHFNVAFDGCKGVDSKIKGMYNV